MTEQNKAGELLPCPFCGSADVEVQGKPAILDGLDSVVCNQCTADAPIHAWQARAARTDPAQGQQVELPDLNDPETVLVNMLRGTIAIPSVRSWSKLFGDVLNDEDARLLEIARLRAELSALKAQQAGQEPVAVWLKSSNKERAPDVLVLGNPADIHAGAYDTKIPLYTAPQPVPAQDVAGSIMLSQEGAKILAEAIGAHAYVLGALVNGRPDLAMNEAKKWVDGFMDAGSSVTAHDKQSGEVKP